MVRGRGRGRGRREIGGRKERWREMRGEKRGTGARRRVRGK